MRLVQPPGLAVCVMATLWQLWIGYTHFHQATQQRKINHNRYADDPLLVNAEQGVKFVINCNGGGGGGGGGGQEKSSSQKYLQPDCRLGAGHRSSSRKLRSLASVQARSFMKCLLTMMRLAQPSNWTRCTSSNLRQHCGLDIIGMTLKKVSGWLSLHKRNKPFGMAFPRAIK